MQVCECSFNYPAVNVASNNLPGTRAGNRQNVRMHRWNKVNGVPFEKAASHGARTKGKSNSELGHTDKIATVHGKRLQEEMGKLERRQSKGDSPRRDDSISAHSSVTASRTNFE